MALLVVILSLGVGGNAWADTGNGNGNGNGNSSTFVPPGQAKKDSGYAFGKPADAVGFANGDTSQVADSQAKAVDSPDSGADASAAKPGSSDHHEGNASTVGTADQTQPLSNADQNNTGTDNTSANGKCPGGPYCSTRDGSPSLNGNGGGQAYGKPCAGCVGKADNKNPHGQYPNWKQDGNKGYECDGNNGIGKTNPAHTGCTGTTPPPTDCRTDHSCPTPPCSQTQAGCPKPPCSQTQAGCPKPPCSATATGCPIPCSQTAAGCPTTCTGGMVSNDSGACSCPENMSEDANGNCYEVGVPVYICPSGMVMHANGTCHCPKGDTMIKGKCTPPDILGIQKTRPRPKTQVTTPQVTTPQVAPAAAGLPNTGAGQGLGIYAMTGAGLLLFGGALMALRRKTVRR